MGPLSASIPCPAVGRLDHRHCICDGSGHLTQERIWELEGINWLLNRRLLRPEGNEAFGRLFHMLKARKHSSRAARDAGAIPPG